MAAGLTVNRQAYREFLRTYSKHQFGLLKEKYGIRLIREISLEELTTVGRRIEGAFHGTDRVIKAADARVAASAWLRGERLATNDLPFFKRAKDLGLDVVYVGRGNAAINAANYVPRPVSW